jgi:hypothetical protein
MLKYMDDLRDTGYSSVGKNSLESLDLIIEICDLSIPYFQNKYQDEVERFIFCGIEKTGKIAKSLKLTYPLLMSNFDLEFSMGILIRSLMMDGIFMQKIKQEIFNKIEISPTTTKEDLAEINSLINEVYRSTKLDDTQKKELSTKFASQFPKAFSVLDGKPKLLTNYKFNIAELYESSQHPNLVYRDAIYNLYTFYSKYDHLSHWTSLPKNLSQEHRWGKIDLGIFLSLTSLRDLLALAIDFCKNYQDFQATVDKIQKHLESAYSSD